MAVVAGPAGAKRVLELVEREPGPVVRDPDLGLGGAAVAAGERDTHAGPLVRTRVPQKLVETVVDELGDALPRRELDVAENPEDAGVRAQIDTGDGLGHKVPSLGLDVTLPSTPDNMCAPGSDSSWAQGHGPLPNSISLKIGEVQLCLAMAQPGSTVVIRRFGMS